MLGAQRDRSSILNTCFEGSQVDSRMSLWCSNDRVQVLINVLGASPLAKGAMVGSMHADRGGMVRGARAEAREQVRNEGRTGDRDFIEKMNRSGDGVFCVASAANCAHRGGFGVDGEPWSPGRRDWMGSPCFVLRFCARTPSQRARMSERRRSGARVEHADGRGVSKPPPPPPGKLGATPKVPRVTASQKAGPERKTSVSNG